MPKETSIPPEEQLRSMRELYWTDSYTWAVQQTEALRRRDFAAIDWDNVIEEIEAIGNREFHRWKNNCAHLIRHMLKLEYYPRWEIQTGLAWVQTIGQARDQMRETLYDNPGLRSMRQEMLDKAWRTGRPRAAADLGIFKAGIPLGADYENARREWERKLPDSCPYDLVAIEDSDWWPEAVERRLVQKHQEPEGCQNSTS